MFYVLDKKHTRLSVILASLVVSLLLLRSFGLWPAGESIPIAGGPELFPADEISAVLMSLQKNEPDRSKEQPVAAPVATETELVRPVVQVTSVTTSYDAYRLERARTRARQVEALRELIADDRQSEQTRASHQQALLDLLKLAEREQQTEELLKARGIQDAIVFVGDDYAHVVVPVSLSREQAAQVGDVVARSVGVRLERVRILDQYAD